jgi:alkanesulfonate monooxygenase SsuD/methylene tetrahydromethanopterin reductase-like flavin-dependent oxidoreductase (luciferase family)
VHLAHALATIDNISNGRVVLGVGAGRSNNQMFVDEHMAVGVPIEERAARMEDSINLLRALWTQEKASSPSEFYPFRDVSLEPKPVQLPIPIWISSNWVQRGLKRVAELGDAWITNVPTVDLFSRCWQRIEDRAGEAGRDPSSLRRCLYISVNLNDENTALSEGDQFMQAYYGVPYELISKQLLCVFGPPQKCIETMLQYQGKGVDYFIVRFASPKQMDQLANFTEFVLPALS